MFGKLKRYGLAAVLVASTFSIATTADARHRRGGGDTAAIAIGAGIVGLAIGAMIADRDDGYYYDRDYYRHRRYVNVSGYPGYYYYYDGYPNRYYRDRYYDRYYGSYYDRRYNNRWDRGYSGRYNRWNRGYERGDRWYGSRRGDYRQDNYRGRGDYRRDNYRDRRRR